MQCVQCVYGKLVAMQMEDVESHGAGLEVAQHKTLTIACGCAASSLTLAWCGG